MSVPTLQNPAIPYGSTIVVSGASGFIGSHVVDQVIAAGFVVRGTTRDAQKTAWVRDYFQGKYGATSFQLFEVPNVEVGHAFDEVVKGAAGFIHVAHDMRGSRDPKIAIDRAVTGALNALKSAAKQPGFKRFVYTSSSFAVTLPRPDEKFTLTVDSFNDWAVQRSKQPDPDGETVYAASKVEAERALSKWVKDNDSPIVVNTIQPNANIGPMISSVNQGYPTSAKWVKALWDHDYGALRDTPPQHFVNVQDDAKLHVLALAHPDIQNERIFAIAGPVSLGDIVGILRKNFPHRTWADWTDDSRDLATYEPSGRVEELLKATYGHGYVGLEESVLGNAADLSK